LNTLKYNQSSAVTAAPRNIGVNLHAPESRIYSNAAGGSWQTRILVAGDNHGYCGKLPLPAFLFWQSLVYGIVLRIDVETDYPDYPDYQLIL
jgi:hypothetical protein